MQDADEQASAQAKQLARPRKLCAVPLPCAERPRSVGPLSYAYQLLDELTTQPRLLLLRANLATQYITLGKNMLRTKATRCICLGIFFLISYAQLNAFYLGNNVLRTMQINAYIWVFLLIFIYATQYTNISRQ